MSSPPNVYFHLGFTKVASTYFQRVVFPQFNGVVFYKKHHFKKYRMLAGKLLKGKYLFSSEKDRRIIDVAKDIIKYYPDAGFIIFLRRQDDWLLSRYKYGIRKHSSESFSEFFDLQNNTGSWKRETLFYKNIITEIEKLSTTKPLVLTYDQLKNYPERFVSMVAAYMDVSIKTPFKGRPVNISFNKKQLIILRKWNRILQYRENVSENKFLKTSYRKTMGLLLHTIAFLGRLTPPFLVKTKSLLTEKDKEELKKIKEFYADDWNFCIQYCSKNMP